MKTDALPSVVVERGMKNTVGSAGERGCAVGIVRGVLVHSYAGSARSVDRDTVISSKCETQLRNIQEIKRHRSKSLRRHAPPPPFPDPRYLRLRGRTAFRQQRLRCSIR